MHVCIILFPIKHSDSFICALTNYFNSVLIGIMVALFYVFLHIGLGLPISPLAQYRAGLGQQSNSSI